MAEGQGGGRIGFIVGGAQKGGTTALAHHLARHPALALPTGKEAHVFDAGDFRDTWTATDIEARFEPHFASSGAGRLRGDATPITVFHPLLVARVARYNPAMRWILLLRDPVDRAISHYHMERARGHERRSLALAVLLERWRLRGHWNDWSEASPLRRWSYAARGRYARQLDVLYRHFPHEQVLLLRSRDLAEQPAQVLARACHFLGVDALPADDAAPERVFAGRYRPPGRLAPGRLLLRWILRGESTALRARHGIDLD